MHTKKKVIGATIVLSFGSNPDFVKNKVDGDQLRASASLMRRVSGYPVMLREKVGAFLGCTPGTLTIGGWPGHDIYVEVSPGRLIAGTISVAEWRQH
jgi:hypothetical protein